MNEIGNSTTGSSVLDGLRNRPQAAAPEEELGKNAFLKLMITQLENQDPLSPQDNSEFIAQLAQFSTVEGLGNLNTTVNGMAAAMRSSSVLQASTLVGRTVRVPSERAVFDGSNPVFGTAVLPTATPDLRVSVLDESGTIVRTMMMGTRPGGDVRFAWDGTNDIGEPQAPGRYLFRADGQFGDGNEQAVVELGANVDSVTIGRDGEVVLNVSGVGPVPMSEVREIR